MDRGLLLGAFLLALFALTQAKADFNRAPDASHDIHADCEVVLELFLFHRQMNIEIPSTVRKQLRRKECGLKWIPPQAPDTHQNTPNQDIRRT